MITTDADLLKVLTHSEGKVESIMIDRETRPCIDSLSMS